MTRVVRGTCAFCPFFGELTKEDALPQWIGRLIHRHMPPKGRWEATRVAVRAETVTNNHTKPVGNPSSTKLKIACRGCNNEWMSRIETAVRPILEPMILDTPTIIDASGQRTLAIWLTKTALVHELITPETAVATDNDRRWFGQEREPFPGSEMWFARYEGEIGSVFYFRRTITLEKIGDPSFPVEAHAQLFTLVAGSVVLQAVIPKRPQLAYFGRRPRPSAVRFWPASDEVGWPPSETMTDGLLIDFTRV